MQSKHMLEATGVPDMNSRMTRASLHLLVFEQGFFSHGFMLCLKLCMHLLQLLVGVQLALPQCHLLL